MAGSINVKMMWDKINRATLDNSGECARMMSDRGAPLEISVSMNGISGEIATGTYHRREGVWFVMQFDEWCPEAGSTVVAVRSSETAAFIRARELAEVSAKTLGGTVSERQEEFIHPNVSRRTLFAVTVHKNDDRHTFFVLECKDHD